MGNISYTQIGDGETILLLHGWGQNKEMMLPLIDTLKHKYKCVLLDLPGFGKSSFNNKVTLDDYCENIHQFLKENNILPKHIVGHSFGGKLAINYFLKYGCVSTLTIIASPILKPKRTLKYYYKIYKYKLKKKLHLKVNNHGSKDYIDCPLNMKKFFINVVNTSFDKYLDKVNIPTLLIWGASDDKVPLKKAKQLNNKIKNSELKILEGSHFAYLENIEFTRLIIQSFLRRHAND